MKGSTFKRRLPSGKMAWCYSVDNGKDADGKRKRIFKSGFRRQKDAEAELNRILQELNEGTFVERDPRAFCEFIKQWLAEYAAKRVTLKTYERYGELLTHITPDLAATPLAKLTTLQIQRCYNRLLDRKKENGQPMFSVKTVRHVHGVLHVALQTAIRWQLLKTNPSAACDLPPVPQREAAALDYDVTAKLLASCENHWLHDLLMVYVASGCRRGELLSLQWRNVDFSTGIVTIARSLEQTQPIAPTAEEEERLALHERRMRAQGLRVKETKGRRVRHVRLSEDALGRLRALRSKQEEARRLYGADYLADLDLVFCHPDGFFIRPDTVTKAARRLAKQAGLRGVSLHTLRHSHGSQLLSAGVPLPVVSRRLGHSNVHVTATVYSHALPADEMAAADIWKCMIHPVSRCWKASRRCDCGRRCISVRPARWDCTTWCTR
jgi:integrase